jgi:hypothetical protein
MRQSRTSIILKIGKPGTGRFRRKCNYLASRSAAGIFLRDSRGKIAGVPSNGTHPRSHNIFVNTT